MHDTAHLVAPDENVFGILAALGRRSASRTLGAVAAASGVIAFGLALAGRADWTVSGICYVVWCFASWGLLFPSGRPATKTGRAVELILVGSAFAVSVIVLAGLFFRALGPRWML